MKRQKRKGTGTTLIFIGKPIVIALWSIMLLDDYFYYSVWCDSFPVGINNLNLIIPVLRI